MKSYFYELITAIRFLTIVNFVPDYLPHETTLGRSMSFFPLVGFFISTLLWIVYEITRYFIPPSSTIVLILVILFIVTGGLHLDAFADTVDGLAGGRNTEERLTIMRDTYIGTAGTVGLILLILAKYNFLVNLNVSQFGKVLFIFPVLGRWATVNCAVLFLPAREDGLGKVFIKNVDLREWYIATGITLIVALSGLGLLGIILMIFVLFICTSCGSFFTRKIGGMTGDTLGAVSEVTEVLVLFCLNFVR